MNAEPEINVPLLRKTLEHITAHPEEHNQANWATRTIYPGLTDRVVSGSMPCGTACCLAGHAVQFAGYQIDWEPDALKAEYVVGGGSIEFIAQRELGITESQASFLFNFRARLGDLYRLAHNYTGGEIEIPERFHA